VGALLALGAGLSCAVCVVIAKAALALPGGGRQIVLGWPWLLYLGVVATAGAYVAYTIGLRDVSASAAGVISLLQPLTATLLGALLFGEDLGAGGLAGATLLFLSLATLVALDDGPPARIAPGATDA